MMERKNEAKVGRERVGKQKGGEWEEYERYCAVPEIPWSWTLTNFDRRPCLDGAGVTSHTVRLSLLPFVGQDGKMSISLRSEL